MKYLKTFELLNKDNDYNRYSIFKEYTLFKSSYCKEPCYYIMKNRGNECQTIFNIYKGEINKAKNKYYYKPDIHTLYNEYMFDSNRLEEVLDELEMILLKDKYNI
jgi:hypothetical protein